MKRQKRSNVKVAILLAVVGLSTLCSAFFVLKGIGTRISTLNKLPGEIAEDGGLYEQYGITTNQLDEMIQSGGSFGNGWAAMALGILVTVGLCELGASVMLLMRRPHCAEDGE
jgi:hypothetical protein